MCLIGAKAHHLWNLTAWEYCKGGKYINKEHQCSHCVVQFCYLRECGFEW